MAGFVGKGASTICTYRGPVLRGKGALQDPSFRARLRARTLPGVVPQHRIPNMSKGDLLEMEGVIQDALGGGQYTIKVDQGGALVRAQLSGRMRRHHIRVLPGDRVRVAVSPYDLTHGLIVYRGRS